MRDEIRLQLHLAGQEARDRWEQHLEPRIDNLELQLRHATDTTIDTVRDAIDRARTAFRDYRAQLSSSGTSTTSGGDEPDFQRVPPDKSGRS